ncbi:MAG: 50S ribosomal protein L23 [Ignavibacteria bacterium]|jgi:large subunit ribosomal protein L23|nr:50S ribosomal protein L23 [Ignavibacteria bacterium]MBK7158071.1 50S ribosomal protein L23 [Ignavibacteria bacterium]MBK7445572.1 50S ribosomal protein L23 [Ignavibacteria bacterium]MBK8382855.1 50S ribosomal protein L23 [Ignavibacteria bacterium]MBK9404125.1 50S ribosomal protein L23 [Ignavibacteria bacterium]
MKTILVKPLITEKNTAIQELLNQYSFEVSRSCNKIEIAKAVEKKFNVRVTNVNTLVLKGKRKSQMTKKGRFEGYRSDRKKAIVTLHKEDKIDFLGNVE